MPEGGADRVAGVDVQAVQGEPARRARVVQREREQRSDQPVAGDDEIEVRRQLRGGYRVGGVGPRAQLGGSGVDDAGEAADGRQAADRGVAARATMAHTASRP